MTTIENNNKTASEIATLLNGEGYEYCGKTAKAWEGETESRIYFGRDYVTLKGDTVTNHRKGTARALTIGEEVVEKIEQLLNA